MTLVRYGGPSTLLQDPKTKLSELKVRGALRPRCASQGELKARAQISKRIKKRERTAKKSKTAIDPPVPGGALRRRSVRRQKTGG